MSSDDSTSAEAELQVLTNRLVLAICEIREARAASRALRAESQELRRFAREVLRKAELRRYELFDGASAALAELEALSRESGKPVADDSEK